MACVFVLGGLAESLVKFRGILLKQMVSLGHQVVACAPNASKTVRDQLAEWEVRYENIRLDRSSINPVRDLLTLKDLLVLLRRHKPEVFIGYTIKPVVYGSLAAYVTGVKSIYSMIEGLGYAFASTNSKNRLIGAVARNLYRVSLRYNKKVFFLNPDDLELFVALKLVRPPQQTVLLDGIGVDLEAFHPATYPKNINFLMIGRLLLDKGVVEYVHAAKTLKQKYPNVHFRLAGKIDVNPMAISRHLLDSWITSSAVEYLGVLADVRPSIADSSVYVLPSYREGVPVTVMESMAMARPVITTTAPGCRETVIDGENGFRVPIKDSHALTEAMEYFIKNPDKIEAMGRASRRIAEQKYCVQATNKIILGAIGLA